jgi:hypothetical protein
MGSNVRFRFDHDGAGNMTAHVEPKDDEPEKNSAHGGSSLCTGQSLLARSASAAVAPLDEIRLASAHR